MIGVALAIRYARIAIGFGVSPVPLIIAVVVVAMWALAAVSPRIPLSFVLLAAAVAEGAVGVVVPPPGNAWGMAFALLATIGVAMSTKYRRTALVSGCLIALVFPLFWDVAEPVALAVTASFGVLVLGGLMVGIQRDAASRADTLFSRIPVGLLEQDWSLVIREMEDLRKRGVEDLAEFLDEHPSELLRLVTLIRTVESNEAAVEIFGAQSLAALNDYLRPDIVTPDSTPELVAALLQVWNSTPQRDNVFRGRSHSGEDRWFQVRSVPHPTRRERIILAALDVSELQRQREELVTLHEAKDRFVASVSHELRTPLSAVVGFLSELAAHDREFSEVERREFLETASREAEEVSNIVEDLLVAARIDSGGVAVVHEPVDLQAQLRAALGSLGEIPIEVRNLAGTVCGDNVRVRQILRNLITNAFRYGGPNRRVIITSGDVFGQVEVRDDGTALSEAEMESLFRPFQQAGRPVVAGSVGLGLTVARELAHRMGGELLMWRDDGETVAALRLPLVGSCSDLSETD